MFFFNFNNACLFFIYVYLHEGCWRIMQVFSSLIIVQNTFVSRQQETLQQRLLPRYHDVSVLFY
jgi:hypothetical protein